MLYLRAITMKNKGSVKDPNRYLVLSFAVDENPYAVTRNVSLWENTASTKAAFTKLCADFSIEEEDVCYAVECKHVFTGEFFTATVKNHYVKDEKGKYIKDDNGNQVTTTKLNSVYCATFGQTQESVVRGFERSWKDDWVDEKEE